MKHKNPKKEKLGRAGRPTRGASASRAVPRLADPAPLPHHWVRRREGRWCIWCKAVEFGVFDLWEPSEALCERGSQK